MPLYRTTSSDSTTFGRVDGCCCCCCCALAVVDAVRAVEDGDDLIVVVAEDVAVVVVVVVIVAVDALIKLLLLCRFRSAIKHANNAPLTSSVPPSAMSSSTGTRKQRQTNR